MTISRRTFILMASTTIFVPPTLAAETADVIYSGGIILTMDESNPRVEAVAVKNGRLLAVGMADEVMRLKSNDTKMVDLGGRTMLPGFIDSHGHVIGGGLQALAANILAPPDGLVDSIAQLQKTLSEWVDANQDLIKEADLILGFGYDNAQLKELRHPTREDLDKVSTDVPVLVVHQSSHLAALNSKALELVGYTADTPDPEGGVIQRQPGSREPNGVLEETAFTATLSKLFRNVGPAGFKAVAVAGSELWASYGYTTAQDARAVPATANALRAVADEGKLKIDVVAFPDVLVDREYIKKNTSSTYKNRFRVAGC